MLADLCEGVNILKCVAMTFTTDIQAACVVLRNL